MAHLPPTSFEDLATKADIAATRREVASLGRELRGEMIVLHQRMDRMDTRIESHLDRLYGMMRTYFLGIVGGFFALLTAIIATGFLG